MVVVKILINLAKVKDTGHGCSAISMQRSVNGSETIHRPRPSKNRAEMELISNCARTRNSRVVGLFNLKPTQV